MDWIWVGVTCLRLSIIRFRDSSRLVWMLVQGPRVPGGVLGLFKITLDHYHI